MTDRSKLLALAEAVAQAKGRDVPLNHEVGSAMHGLGWHPADCLLDFTGSIDGAARVVPQGWYWMAGDRDRSSPRAYVENGAPAFEGMSARRNPDRRWFEVTAATPALALLSSALRAQAEALA